LADEKLYKAEYMGSGTFLITKPKRKKTKARQTKLKNLQRGARR
jgi:preprotein translocase subunit YajC